MRLAVELALFLRMLFTKLDIVSLKDSILSLNQVKETKVFAYTIDSMLVSEILFVKRALETLLIIRATLLK